MNENGNVVQLIHKAIDLSDGGDHSKAIAMLTKAISIDPLSEQAFFERGMANLELNNNADAIADFDRALEINPEYSGAGDWRARTLSSLGKCEEAAEDQLKNLRDNPDGKHGMGVSPQSWADCANSYISAGIHNKAKELLEEYFSDYSGNLEAYTIYETAPMRILSELLIQSGEFERAVEFAKRAYNSKHQVPADVLTYALSLEASGDIDNAKKIFEEAMKINDQMPGIKELSQRLAE